MNYFRHPHHHDQPDPDAARWVALGRDMEIVMIDLKGVIDAAARSEAKTDALITAVTSASAQLKTLADQVQSLKDQLAAGGDTAGVQDGLTAIATALNAESDKADAALAPASGGQAAAPKVSPTGGEPVTGSTVSGL